MYSSFDNRLLELRSKVIWIESYQVFLLCLLAGCSICWFNTVCFVLCIQNFPVNRSLALALTISFNGVSAAFYSLAANALVPVTTTTTSSSSSYLLLNAILPLLASLAALPPILRPPPSSTTSLPPDGARRDSHAFLLLNILAFFTGLYLLLLNCVSSASSNTTTARLLLAGAISLLVLPLCIPGLVFAREWARRKIYSNYSAEASDGEDADLQKGLLDNDQSNGEGNVEGDAGDCTSWVVLGKDRISMLGQEHGVRRLVKRVDFWLYYVAYFSGATVGLVYSNNLGQIAQSLGRQDQTSVLVAVYSACSFFGRLASAAPDFLRG